MIPKVIHYCWFGRNPLPPLAIKCINSWKKYMPDYEIKEWNEDNFDVKMIPYIADAYDAKKYAFVSDFARFWILYHYGGLYFDTDVEMIKPFNDILAQGAFMGAENYVSNHLPRLNVAPGLGLGCEPNNKVVKGLIEMYEPLSFSFEGKVQTIVHLTSSYLRSIGLENTNSIQCLKGITIYPADFFAPLYHNVPLTANSHSIHHYARSWYPRHKKIKYWFKNHIPHWMDNAFISLKRKFKK